MTSSPPAVIPLVPPQRRGSGNRGKWMALIAALLGWMFDGFEMGMFPLVGQPALMELLATPIPLDASPEQVEALRAATAVSTSQWFGVIIAVFLVGAATGGVLFGWLGDRIGRVRAMSLSIFTYAIFTGLAGFATEPWHIAATRFIASLGMGGEWSLGVALVIEIWPDKSRAFMAGLIGAASNVGFFLVALMSLALQGGLMERVPGALEAIGVSGEFSQRLVSHQGWRLIMMLGALPALLIFFIRLFVPESEKWAQEKAKGATSHWATHDLLAVVVGCFGAMGVVYVWSPAVESWAARAAVTPLGIAIALIGYIYPVLRYLGRAQAAGAIDGSSRRTTLGRLLLGASLSGVALLGTWGALQWVAKWSLTLEGADPTAKDFALMSVSIGAVMGTILAALAAGRFGRRITYSVLCVGSTASMLYLYQTNDTYDTHFLLSALVAGGITAAFYGWFPLYLPELFGTSIRATSQGFAFNFGRIIAAIAGLQTAQIMGVFGGDLAQACSVLSFIYLVGVFIVWIGPETKGKPLPQ